ncbi:hypothetical protein FGG08_005777 [Glutinoglossum americanum]|uniref:AMP-binding enzyme C-terminal domain-containing protein n=1 Tax=Glutinoglossum americanum TaxID=1670608 RepID=A0A9P8HXS1_9PEZI|nr:hypothetical protein FGG08_005777 [Glutinoglossum americanum]
MWNVDWSRAKVVDPSDRKKTLPIGARGELAVSGYLVMKGYWRDAARTAEVLVSDDKGKTWMHTGDEAEMDNDGYIKITSRIKDIIIKGGENIHPLEIENCLFGHPEIAEASVVGLPDERYGEVVAVYVICHKSSKVSASEVRHWVRDKLSHHLGLPISLVGVVELQLTATVPKYVFFVDSYPKTASGKIQKFKLRELGIQQVRQGYGLE